MEMEVEFLENEPEIEVEKNEEQVNERKNEIEEKMEKLKEDVEAIRKNQENTIANIKKSTYFETGCKSALKAVQYVGTTVASAFIFLKVADLYNGVGKSTNNPNKKTHSEKMQKFFAQIGKIYTSEHNLYLLIDKWFEDNREKTVKLDGNVLKVVSLFEITFTAIGEALVKLTDDAAKLDQKKIDTDSWDVVTLADTLAYAAHSKLVIEKMRELQEEAKTNSAKISSAVELAKIVGDRPLKDIEEQQAVLDKMPMA